jgi:hypothetical protein
MIRGEIVINELHEGGFALAVAAKETGPFALFDMQGHLIEDQGTAKADANVL